MLFICFSVLIVSLLMFYVKVSVFYYPVFNNSSLKIHDLANVKHTIQQFLGYSESFTTTTTINFRSFSLLQKQTSYPLAVTPPLPQFSGSHAYPFAFFTESLLFSKAHLHSFLGRGHWKIKV